MERYILSDDPPDDAGESGAGQQISIPGFGAEWPSTTTKPINAPMSGSGIVHGAFPSSMVTVTARTLPFVPPEVLREYEAVRPGIGNKLIEWTDRQQNHRMDLENRAQSRSLDRQDRSQMGSLTVALTGLLLAAIVAVHGEQWAAAIIAIVSVGGPIAAIVLANVFGRQSSQSLPPIPQPNTNPPTPSTPSPRPGSG